MRRLRLVIVEPKYQVNLGYIARAAKNFGIDRLTLVRPRCDYEGSQAVKYAKHARDLLLGARVCGSLPAATRGSFVVGTTGIWEKTGQAFHNVYTPGRAARIIRKQRSDVSLLIGRDDTGLSKEELAMCDATIFIPTSKEYPVLNISHALAILLYVLSGEGAQLPDSTMYAGSHEIAMVKRLFSMSIAGRSDIRDKEAVAMAFGHLLSRASPTKKELGALSVALSPRRGYLNAAKNKK